MSKIVKGGETSSTTIDSHHNAALTVLSDKLTSSEKAALEELEQKIGSSLLTFIDIGNALAAIRDQHLYRQEYGTFEKYCRDRWNFSRQRAHQFLRAAPLAEYLSTIVDVSPTNETQIRPLIPLSDEEAAKAWQLAEQLSGSKSITEKFVSQAVKELHNSSGATPENDDGKNIVEAELIVQTTEESFDLADGTQSRSVSFSESTDVVTADAVGGKLQQMAENNSRAEGDHRKRDDVIAGQQAALIELVDTANSLARHSSSGRAPEQIYRAADELLHLLAHRRPVPSTYPK